MDVSLAVANVDLPTLDCSLAFCGFIHAIFVQQLFQRLVEP